jgi:hypothetical protein
LQGTGVQFSSPPLLLQINNKTNATRSFPK